jgi:hypothetical protein
VGQAVAEQLRAAVQAREMLDAGLQDVPTLSTLPTVPNAAAMACYDAKRAGCNRVETHRARKAAASGGVLT